MSFDEAALLRIKGSGTKTVHQLKILQDNIVKEYPELRRLVERRQVAAGRRKVKVDLSGPEDWSILHRTLPDLFQLSPPPFHDEMASGLTISGLGIPEADLDRLRSAAIYPEDSTYLLLAVSAGYLSKLDISDDAISIMLGSVAELSGRAGVSLASISTAHISDAPLYRGIAPDLLDSLHIPGFCYPALFEAKLQNSAASWGEVATITERTVIKRLGFSLQALQAVEYLWLWRDQALLLQEAVLAGLPQQAYGEFERLADAYLRLALGHPAGPGKHVPGHFARNYRFCRARFQFLDGPKDNLAELGRREQVTRERVRQVERDVTAVLKSKNMLKHLAYWRRALDHLISAGGGVCLVGELAEPLGDLLGWKTLPSDEALASFIGLSPDYQVVLARPIRVIMTRHRCASCEGIRSVIPSAVERAPEGILSFDQALTSMREFCQGLRCRELDKITDRSKGLLLLLIDSAEGISCKDRCLYAGNAWLARHAPINQALEHIMRTAGKAIHFKDVQLQFNRMRPEQPVSRRNIYSRLQASPLLISWGRGTFIHKDLMSVPTPLLAEIEEEILSRLDSHDIPYVAVNGSIFESFQNRLTAENVPNPPALYSCMRTAGSSRLTFAEYPYVLRKGDNGVRLPVETVLEDFLKKQKEPVSLPQLNAFGTEILGIELAQLQNYRHIVPNVLRVQRGLYLHASILGTDEQFLAPIFDYLKGCGPITALQLYRQNTGTCRSLGISTPMLLYSLIHHFFPGRFPVSSASNGTFTLRKLNQPPKVSSGKSVAQRRPPTRINAPEAVETYLESVAQPCRTKDLLEHFQGTSESHLRAILRDKNKFLRHSLTSLVARSMLDWTDEKQKEIEELAFRHLEEREKSGKPFGLCSEIVRDRSRLPEIAGHVSWTPVLLQDLLGSGERYIALGRSRNIIVSASNSHGIHTLGDLALHILKTDHGGAAQRASFNSGLRRIGIMKEKLPPLVAGKDSRVVIDGDVIRIAELHASRLQD